MPQQQSGGSDDAPGKVIVRSRSFIACMVPSGKLIKSWSYSQGYFEFTETSLARPEEAEDFSKAKHNFDTHFKNRGCKLVKVEVETSVWI